MAPSLPNVPTQGLWVSAGEEVAGGEAGLQGVLHRNRTIQAKGPQSGLSVLTVGRAPSSPNHPNCFFFSIGLLVWLLEASHHFWQW